MTDNELPAELLPDRARDGLDTVTLASGISIGMFAVGVTQWAMSPLPTRFLVAVGAVGIVMTVVFEVYYQRGS